MSTRTLADGGIDDFAFNFTMLANVNAFLEFGDVEFFVFNFRVLGDAERLFGFPTFKLGELCLFGEKSVEGSIQVSECSLE
jgi:hypothetical protein